MRRSLLDNKIKYFYYPVLLLFTLLSLVNCEFEPTDENFVDIEIDSNNPYFNLSILSESDTIKIFKKTDLGYNFDTDNLDLFRAEFSLKEDSWIQYNKNGSITINPDDFEAGYDTLTLTVYTNSGTGSIADKIGAEGYVVQKQWLVLVDGRDAPEINSYRSITEDGFLKLTWDKCDQYNFYCYEISQSLDYSVFRDTIYDPNVNWIVDSTFVAGDVSLIVSCRTIDDHTWGKLLQETIPEPNLNFEEIGYDSIRLYWDKCEYNARFKLEWDDETIYCKTKTDTSVTIPHVGFSNITKFTLYTLPANNSSWNTDSYTIYDNLRYVLGEHIADNWPMYGYNPIEKVVYTNGYSIANCYDVFTMNLVNSKGIPYLMYEGEYSCPTNSSKVAIMSMDSAYVFNDNNLINPIVIPYDDGGAFNINHFFLSDNDKLAIASRGVYNLYNINTKKKLLELDISSINQYSSRGTITTAQDAKKVALNTGNSITMYQIDYNNDDVTFAEIYTVNEKFYSAYFNPYNVNEIFVTPDTGGFEIRNASDFSLIQKIKSPVVMFVANIDPETGYLLLQGNGEMFVYNLDTSQLIYEMKGTAYATYLYNSILFAKTGYYLNISKELN